MLRDQRQPGSEPEQTLVPASSDAQCRLPDRLDSFNWSLLFREDIGLLWSRFGVELGGRLVFGQVKLVSDGRLALPQFLKVLLMLEGLADSRFEFGGTFAEVGALML